ncbi:hypothetical protein NT2_04_00080 [Caenibius tardaugens NBRC 16725]|uniref:Uncharacterized protein n=1 Tax=Caenibius tardaugens NBRC 16725 TaxID=1219035 RepID=U2YK13_9SPHN|nr:hypothetical protein [Caenibius tardaugens]AZI36286.1 hypothetical protein EGO55_10245 [Caenibius tardaugens NBRC 16725]GAD48597.1 hypothetical protein NT2_04_00080 [Caenibius tardaugens NBRC 16725]
MNWSRARFVCAAIALFASAMTAAQAQNNTPRRSPQNQQPAPQEGPRWQNLPQMQLEAVYAAPLADTVIQRMRDPIDGTICFLYSPIEAPHNPPSPRTGYLNYGGVNIGSISCVAGSVITIPTAPPPGRR